MTELEMIAEWRKGCSCASKEHPEECTACTRGLVDALEAKLRAATPPAAKGTTYGYKASFRAGEFEQVCAGLTQQPAAQAAGLTDDEIERLISRFIGNVAPGLRNDCRALVLEVLSRAAPSGEPVAWSYECRECGRCGHTGINDAHSQDECCSNCDWTGPAPKEDVCPGCAQTGTMRAACPKCGSVYRLLCETTVGAAPQRSAQQADPNAGEVERMLDADEQPAEEARGVEADAVTVRITQEERDKLRKAADFVRSSKTDCEDSRLLALAVMALLAAPAAGTGQADPLRDAVEAMVRMLEDGEWAEHVATTTGKGDALAHRLEAAITDLHNQMGDTAPQAATGAKGLTREDILRIGKEHFRYGVLTDDAAVDFARAVLAASRKGE